MMTRDEQLAQREFMPDDLTGVVTVCMTSHSHENGADAVLRAVQDELASKQRDDVQVRTTGCLGLFSAGVVVKITRAGWPPVLYKNVSPDAVLELMSKHLDEEQPVLSDAFCQIPINGPQIDGIPTIDEIPFFGLQKQMISWRSGYINPERIEESIRGGAYQMQDAALQYNPNEVMEIIKTGQIHGHGGRGEQVAMAWEEAAIQTGDKYLICNALEVEKSSFKDRRLLESDPHAFIEGMTIAAHAIGAKKGYVILNPQYTRVQHVLEVAITQARLHGRLGQSIRGSSMDFDIIVRQGPPGYIMGEDTTLISFLSGETGPRSVPPSITVSGFEGCPTVVANVETFFHLTTLPFGAEEECPPPTRLFTLEGTKHTGVVEVEVGTTLRDIVCEIGGTPESQIKAINLGGRIGGILSPDLLDTPLTRQSYRWLGIWPGSGLINVLDHSTSIPGWLKEHLKFGTDESCGYCTPCREGMAQAYRLMEQLCDGQGQSKDLMLLDQLANYIKTSSMCGYGHAVPGGVTTAIQYFGSELRGQIKS